MELRFFICETKDASTTEVFGRLLHLRCSSNQNSRIAAGSAPYAKIGRSTGHLCRRRV